jgi:hypothetical protein
MDRWARCTTGKGANKIIQKTVTIKGVKLYVSFTFFCGIILSIKNGILLPLPPYAIPEKKFNSRAINRTIQATIIPKNDRRKNVVAIASRKN